MDTKNNLRKITPLEIIAHARYIFTVVLLICCCGELLLPPLLRKPDFPKSANPWPFLFVVFLEASGKSTNEIKVSQNRLLDKGRTTW